MKNNLFFLQESLPFWKNLNENQKNLLLNSSFLKTFLKNTILSGNNNECTGFLIVKSGHLRIYINNLSEDNVYVKSFVLDLVSSRFSDVMWIFEQYVFSNMAQRLANTLLEQASLNNSKSLDITHEYIARELGTAREVITRLLKQFQADNIVKLSRNKIEILNLDELQKT